ncbi:hypothetical protein POPTR_016G000501v4 [Populus trichocarpa]|uniref:Uncharacterized protein n=1 Tax=Populus trichocarpa TaxID=3694 RepID=U5FN24_POPTR|nr:hypothetical protein POPTR_016G000501v4 [Populus trichocarpa]
MALKLRDRTRGSLRNIDNAWKAEPKHRAEQKKLIQDERERSEFRLLQQAGLVTTSLTPPMTLRGNSILILSF